MLKFNTFVIAKKRKRSPSNAQVGEWCWSLRKGPQEEEIREGQCWVKFGCFKIEEQVQR